MISSESWMKSPTGPSWPITYNLKLSARSQKGKKGKALL